MYPTVGQLIRRHRERHDLTLSVLAKQVGISRGYLSMIENDRVLRPPSLAVLRALEHELQIADGALQWSADWQNTPLSVQRRFMANARLQGGMLIAAGGFHGSNNIHESGVGASSSVGSRRVDKQTDRPGLEAEYPVGRDGLGGRWVPLINQPDSRFPQEVIDTESQTFTAMGYVVCPELSDPGAFGLYVVDDAMEPAYRRGDIVICSPAADVEHGCDCLALIYSSTQPVFRRVFYDPGEPGLVRLQPLVPHWQPLVLPRAQLVGVYRGVWRIHRL